MTGRGRSTKHSTKNWWRRHHSPVHPPAARAATFEFAHLLDGVGPQPVCDGVAVSDDVRQCIEQDEPVRDDPNAAFEQLVNANAVDPTPWGEVDALLGTPAPKALEPITGPVASTPANLFELIELEEPALVVAEPLGTEPGDTGATALDPAPPATSRFASAGLDDDRLPMIRRRRLQR